MAVLGPKQQQGRGLLQSQLARSLERLLEEASQSGELKLSNRKLKDFPNSDKYDLSDTVVADLSKNRLSELPDEVTRLRFLERLSCYHNAIRSVPDSVAHLQSLTFLDLSRNQLTLLPRELCLLPIQILVVSHNRLCRLPDDLHRMTRLSELEASCNELTHFPPRLAELRQLQALGLRRNLLQAVPVEVAGLPLARLDLRENRITALPVDMRAMAALRELLLDDNPLTSPPASLCKRGRVHIFKYLEDEALKFERKTGVTLGGTLSRRTRKGGGNTSTVERLQRQQRHNVDSGYSTGSDCNADKRWSQETHLSAPSVEDKVTTSTPTSSRSLDRTSSATSTPSTVSPTPPDDSKSNNTTTISSPSQHEQQDGTRNSNNSNNNNVRLSPCVDSLYNNSNEEKTTPLHQIQTYREYKEALRQQRAQEGPSIYRAKEAEYHSAYKTEPNTPTRHVPPTGTALPTSKSDPTPLNSGAFAAAYSKPVQKVPPSRAGVTYTSTPPQGGYTNGHHAENETIVEFVKPSSPVKSPRTARDTPTVVSPVILNGNSGNTPTKSEPPARGTRAVTWGVDTSASDKMTFTMRREFDKAREETDLINQLRNIIESRLKMSLPEDLATALTDGVVLCHLANHIRPRSVASIHVPSPAVPKLTMARCRRNVDNFIEACRKIGVDEKMVCCAADVLEGKGLVRVAITVAELLRFHSPRAPPPLAASALSTVV